MDPLPIYVHPDLGPGLPRKGSRGFEPQNIRTHAQVENISVAERFDDVLRLSPGHREAAAHLADINLRRGRLTNAREQFQAATREGGSDA